MKKKKQQPDTVASATRVPNAAGDTSSADATGEKKTQRPQSQQQQRTFTPRNVQILRSYNNVFSKKPSNLADADTLFRRSLRNYSDFDYSGKKWYQPKLRSRFSDVKRSRTREGLCRYKSDTSCRTESLKSPLSDTASRAGSRTVFSEGDFDRSSPDVVLVDEQTFKEVKVSVRFEEAGDDIDSFHSLSADELITEIIQTYKMADEEQAEPAAEEVPEEAAEEVPEEGAAEDGAPEEEAAVEGEAEEGDKPLETLPEEAPPEGGDVQAEKEGDDLKEVGQMIEAADAQMKEVVRQASKHDTGSRRGSKDSRKSVTVKDEPAVDSEVIRELEEAQKQAMKAVQIINELKNRVAELLQKPKMTEVENKEIEEKNLLLLEHMANFEEQTKRLQYLVAQRDLKAAMLPKGPPVQKKHKEDMLPKVIFCGTTENNMPKIIICDSEKKKEKKEHRRRSSPSPEAMPQFAKRLSESYEMQEQLAVENANLEGKRYKLQEELLSKDHTVENLQRKVESLQSEMRMVLKENATLSEKLNKYQEPEEERSLKSEPSVKSESKSNPPCAMPCGKGKGPCPADVESRLQEYSNTTQALEKQLALMEEEVRTMQSELSEVQRERKMLEQQKKMLQCGAPCSAKQQPMVAPPPEPRRSQACCCVTGMGAPQPQVDMQARELKEQYDRLQDDYKSKLTEVAGLRTDLEKSRQMARDAEALKSSMEEKLKAAEQELKSFKSEKSKLMGSKEQLIEQEQQLNVAKQRFREAQDELEELRALIHDQGAQLEDYRKKYLQAEQQVEEQRRQLDLMEMENSRVSEQVNMEIQRVKNQFQERLSELTPLPDILKATQMKLQEVQQMHLMSERNNEALMKELQVFKDKAAAMANQMEKVRSDQQLGADEVAALQSKIDEWDKKCAELQKDNEKLKTDLARAEEAAIQNESRLEEKLHEIAQLTSQLDTVREESARQVARTKDRCETVRRSMQNQIADLERQLAQSRAQARTAQKERDEIRQKMQTQINNLNQNFEEAQMRIRSLQGHVNFLKSSYTNIFGGPDVPQPMMSGEPTDCDCGSNF